MKIARNKVNLICLISAVLLIAAIISAMPHTFGAEGNPELFINDKPWYNTARYPLNVRDGVVYVPITAFTELPDVIINVYDDKEIFYIDNQKAKKYVSFFRSQSLAHISASGETVENVKTFIYGDTVYVPLQFVASAIGISTSQYRSTAMETTYYRMYNGSQKLSFEELLRIYKPNALNTTDPPPPVTKPPESTDTEPIDTDINTDIVPVEPTSVYLTFKGAPETDSKIFDILAEFKAPAAFFIDSNDIKTNLEGVLRIYYSGYTLALTEDEKSPSESFTEFMKEIGAANELLSRTLKTKSHVISKYGGSLGGEFDISVTELSELSSVGYIVWDCSIDGTKWTSASSINRNVKKALKDDPSPVIRLGTDKRSADALKLLLEYFSDSGLYVPEKITIYMTEHNDFSYNAE